MSIETPAGPSVTVRLPPPPETPVVAPPSALAGTGQQALRNALQLAFGGAASWAFHDGNLTGFAAALGLALAPWLWGFIEKVRHNKRTATLINMLPNQWAHFKGERK